MALVIFGGAAAHKSPALVGSRSLNGPQSGGVAVIYAPCISETQLWMWASARIVLGAGLDAGWVWLTMYAADEVGSFEKTATGDVDAR